MQSSVIFLTFALSGKAAAAPSDKGIFGGKSHSFCDAQRSDIRNATRCVPGELGNALRLRHPASKDGHVGYNQGLKKIHIKRYTEFRRGSFIRRCLTEARLHALQRLVAVQSGM